MEKKLFEPANLGSMRLKNRLVRSATWEAVAFPDGGILRGEPEGVPPDRMQHALVDALFELNPGMEIIYPDDKRYICDVFYIADGEGEHFDLSQKPIFRNPFSIGNGGASRKPI